MTDEIYEFLRECSETQQVEGAFPLAWLKCGDPRMKAWIAKETGLLESVKHGWYRFTDFGLESLRSEHKKRAEQIPENKNDS